GRPAGPFRRPLPPGPLLAGNDGRAEIPPARRLLERKRTQPDVGPVFLPDTRAGSRFRSIGRQKRTDRHAPPLWPVRTASIAPLRYPWSRRLYSVLKSSLAPPPLMLR